MPFAPAFIEFAIRNGLQDCVVCGGAQEANLYSVAAFDGIQSFSVCEDAPEKASRPFDRDRDGLVPGGGAATLIVESYEHAVKRGAPILAEIVSWGFSFCIREDNFFLEADGRLAEIGVIEHIAQSASALFGYKAALAGVSEPEVRYIGEVKKFRCYRCPAVGETLHTVITVEMEVEGITLVHGETRVGSELIAETQMKLSDKT